MLHPFRDNLLNAPLAAGVRRVGFRKWYERELLASHAHMVLAIFAVIALLASFEAMGEAPPAQKLTDLACILVSAAVTLWAMRRYLFLLMRAEVVAHQASCEDCGAYGRFKVVGESHGGNAAQVACLKCAHRWTISSEDEE